MNTKKELRKSLKTKRKALTESKWREMCALVNKNLFFLIEALWQDHDPRSKDVIGLYASYQKEVQVSALEDDLHSIGLKTAYPRTLEGSNSMDFVVSSIDELKIQKARPPILEPHHAKKSCAKKSLFALIAPGIGFDYRGHRLGWGAGYYDRFFSETSCISIGVGFEFQLQEKIPFDPWDHVMDWVVTEKGAIQCSHENNHKGAPKHIGENS
jgi:5-formyltetrahydrofolate cyclo-ligase